MPPNCPSLITKRGETTSDFSFNSSHEESNCYHGLDGFGTFSDLAQYVFAAKMSYNPAGDDYVNKTWTIRLGTGGYIYSMDGPMGETVEPQRRPSPPWVNEV